MHCKGKCYNSFHNLKTKIRMLKSFRIIASEYVYLIYILAKISKNKRIMSSKVYSCMYVDISNNKYIDAYLYPQKLKQKMR